MSALKKTVIVQPGIVATLLVLFRPYLPRMQRHKATADTAARERWNQAFTKSMIVA